MSEPAEGHNSRVAADELKQFVERIERLQGEKKTISDDIRDIYVEVKDRGFNKNAVAYVVKVRGQDRDKRLTLEADIDLYMTALGLV